MKNVVRVRNTCKNIYTDPTFDFYYRQFITDKYITYDHRMQGYESLIFHDLYWCRGHTDDCDHECGGLSRRSREYREDGDYEPWMLENIERWERLNAARNGIASYLGFTPPKRYSEVILCSKELMYDNMMDDYERYYRALIRG